MMTIPHAPSAALTYSRYDIKQVCVQLLRTLTTWHCPHSLDAAAAAMDHYLLPAGLTAANL